MMVNRSDWETAYRDVIERARERVGDPPTPEDLVAWSCGELPEREAERIRELLAYYPDLAEALAEGDQAAEDEMPILTRDQIAADWELLQQRMSPAVSPQVAAAARREAKGRGWIIVPIAAAILFAGLFVHSRFTIRELRRQLMQPQENVERIELLENVSRGGTAGAVPVKLQPSTKHVVIALTVVNDVKASAFRMQIRDLDTGRVAWAGNVTRGRDRTFSVVVPRSFLASRTYAVDLYGNGRRIATYDFWLSQ